MPKTKTLAKAPIDAMAPNGPNGPTWDDPFPHEKMAIYCGAHIKTHPLDERYVDTVPIEFSVIYVDISPVDQTPSIMLCPAVLGIDGTCTLLPREEIGEDGFVGALIDGPSNAHQHLEFA